MVDFTCNHTLIRGAISDNKVSVCQHLRVGEKLQVSSLYGMPDFKNVSKKGNHIQQKKRKRCFFKVR